MDNQKIFMPSLTSGELIPLDNLSTAVAKVPNPPENSSAEISTVANLSAGAPVKINNFLSPTPSVPTVTPSNDNSSL